jgi:hypothetical protein
MSSAVNNSHPTSQALPAAPQAPEGYPNNEFLMQQLQAQVEFYFCSQNLANDKFLQDQLSQTEHLGAVPIQVICSFRKIRQLYSFAANVPVEMMPPADPTMLRMALENSSVLSISHDGMFVIPNANNNNKVVVDQDDAKDTAATVETSSTPSSPSSTGTSSLGNQKDRSTIIIRDVPSSATEQMILEAFKFAPKSAKADEGNTAWYVLFETNDDATKALASDIVIDGTPIRGSLKSSQQLQQQQTTAPPAMTLTPQAAPGQAAPGGAYPNMMHPTPYPFQQPYGFLPMHPPPYGMPMQQQTYHRVQQQYYPPPQPYGYYAPHQQQRQNGGGIPPQNVFVRPPPQQTNLNHRPSNPQNTLNNNQNASLNKRRTNNHNNHKKNNNRRNRTLKDQSSEALSRNKQYNTKHKDNEQKNKFKANRKKQQQRNSPKVDLSSEHFPALGGKAFKPTHIQGPAYAQALLKRPFNERQEVAKSSDPKVLEKAMNDMAIAPNEEW